MIAPRDRDRERGSLSLFAVIFTLVVLMLAGLVYDGGLAIAARQRAADVAESAARAGANAVDVEAFRARQVLVVDQAEACDNAREVVARDGDGSLQDCWVDPADGQLVHVRVHVTVRPQLLALFRFPPFQAEADAGARPVQGL
jgi:hypothetical protein